MRKKTYNIFTAEKKIDPDFLYKKEILVTF